MTPALLWALAALPVLLWGLCQASPMAAVRTWLALRAGVGAALWYGALAALVLLLFPPFPAAVRLWFARAMSRLRADHAPYQRAEAELRSFETAARRLEAGRAALAIDEPRRAASHLERALELEPEQLAARFQLGLARLALGELEAAGAAFAQVERQSPGHAFGDALLLLGRVRMLQRDFTTAAELLERHRREHGGNRRSHHWLGTCLRAEGDRQRARVAFAVAADRGRRFPRTAEENWYRACAAVALWTLPRLAAPADGAPR